MSHFHSEDTRYPPGPPSRPFPRKDDRDSRMYDDHAQSRSRSPGGTVYPRILNSFVRVKIWSNSHSTLRTTQAHPALPLEDLQPTGVTIIPETIPLQDPNTEAETTMISEDDPRGLRPVDRGIAIETAIVKGISLGVEAEATVPAEVEAPVATDRITDTRAER
ncbi:uncharacterized protein BJX67DRAFT_381335 [Aspergillus lucknowensis]|uniref:Uncharacterized protein n=1 Tax=Aspergillus lucknowensis TaxID=176173 RepID=A0ABR4LR52_9EURO